MWDYVFYIQNIFTVGVTMPSTSKACKSIETEWYLVPSSIHTKGSIFKRKFLSEQQIFHCSKQLEMVKSSESSFWAIKCLSFKKAWSKITSSVCGGGG